jgi:hypothetical protein
MSLSYVEKKANSMQIDNDCNYIDPENMNSREFIQSCIKNPSQENPFHYDKCLNLSIQLEDNVEGFSNDHSSKGPGVSYTPLGMCHDGYIRGEDGKCNILEYRGRVRDGNWQRGQHSETMHDGKENYNICGINSIFLGLSNGHPRCELKENTEEPVIEGFNINISNQEERNSYEEIR